MSDRRFFSVHLRWIIVLSLLPSVISHAVGAQEIQPLLEGTWREETLVQSNGHTAPPHLIYTCLPHAIAQEISNPTKLIKYFEQKTPNCSLEAATFATGKITLNVACKDPRGFSSSGTGSLLLQNRNAWDLDYTVKGIRTQAALPALGMEGGNFPFEINVKTSAHWLNDQCGTSPQPSP